MKTMVDLVGDHPFFAELEPSTVETIAGCASNVVFDAGTSIFREDAPADRFYLVRHGRVVLEIRRPEQGPQAFATVDPGDVLGVSWLIPPYRWSFDARASTTIRAVAFDVECLRGHAEANPAIGYALMKRFVPVLVARLQAARLQALDLYGSSS